MGNWDYVFPYDDAAVDWLTKEGVPHPAVAPGNRWPTLRELRTIAGEGVFFDVYTSDEDEVLSTVKMRGESYEAELRAIYALAKICGQQWIYPDSGAPSIVVDPRIDLERAVQVWREANTREDGWRWLYEELYGR